MWKIEKREEAREKNKSHKLGNEKENKQEEIGKKVKVQDKERPWPRKEILKRRKKRKRRVTR